MSPFDQDDEEHQPNVGFWWVKKTEEGEIFDTPWSWKMPNWPYPFTVYLIHDWLEYSYEFFRGFRLGTDSQLDVCEVAFSSLFESWYEANNYLSFAF